MPSTVAHLFAAAGLHRDDSVLWNTAVQETGPGVYVVALTPRADSVVEARATCPLSMSAIGELLATRSELRVDRVRPDANTLATRLAAFWLPDEVVLYVGLAGTSVHARVNAYYGTRIGARSPHAGGWFLKMLSVLPQLHVHFAPAHEPTLAEDRMLAAFSAQVSDAARSTLHDPDRPIPFANIEWPKRRYKRHGITGAKQPKAPRASVTAAPPAASPAPAATEAPLHQTRSQRVTAADLAAGRIRIPRGAPKALLPATRQDIDITLRGERLRCRWDPRTGPDQERSGVLAVGRRVLQALVEVDDVLDVRLRDGIPDLR